MNSLNVSTCRRGVPLRKLWTAEETRLVKTFLNEFIVIPWNQPYAEVDRSDAQGRWVIRVPNGGGGPPYDGEVWVMGYHLYDASNFSPANTNGSAITGEYEGAVWLQIDLGSATPTASYSEAGPSGANWGNNKCWRRLSECGGAGKYILC